MLFRQAALLILAGVLPLAAAGSIAPMTRAWIRKVTAWMLALICYKPAAAAVYAAAFTMIGSGGSPRTVLMGFVMLLLSVLMLPALMKFFTWTTGAIASSGGGGQFLGAATVGAIAVGAMRSGPGAAGRRRKTRPPTSTPGSARRRSGRPPGGPGGRADGPPARGQVRAVRAARARLAQWPVAQPAARHCSGRPAARRSSSRRRRRRQPAALAGRLSSPAGGAGAPGRPATAAAAAASAASGAGAAVSVAAEAARAAPTAPGWQPARWNQETGDDRRPRAGAHLRRVAAQPRHRPAGPGPGRHPGHCSAASPR